MTSRSGGQCDILITGGHLVDGTGAAPVVADVAVTGDRITAVGKLDGMTANTRVDAADLIVAPGFIDVHTHDDRAVLSGPDMTPKISQGVTTVVAGNCGVSLAPLRTETAPPPPMNLLGDQEWYRFPSLGEYRDAFAAEAPSVNLAMLVGHSTLRTGAMDELTRAATAEETNRMAEALEQAMEQGALGLSTGLAYATAEAAPTEEVKELARRMAPYGGLYTTHMRDEGDYLLEAVEEALDIGRDAGARVVISHHKATGRENWGKTKDSLTRIAEARAEQAVDLDVYPYTASSTVLVADWIEGCEKVLISWSESHPEVAGRDLVDIAREWGCSRLEAADKLQPAGAIYFQMQEEDLQRVLSFPRAMIGSDGLPHDARPHPRLWGTFPRILGHYCRDLGLFTLEEAVHRMTGIPAEVFGFKDRGRVAVGCIADLVLFDRSQVIDRADYAAPTTAADGIRNVIVNGQIVWDGEAVTAARPGRFLERNGAGSV